jgi:hypothetical protein
MSDIIYENNNYKVVLTDDALGEDGQYGRRGYAVVNTTTNVAEHTTTVLPQALFQADAFLGALGQLNDSQDDEIAIIQAVPEDVLPN